MGTGRLPLPRVWILRAWIVAGAALWAVPGSAQDRRVLTPSLTPERRGGHALVGARLLGLVLGEECRWLPAERAVVLGTGDRAVRLRPGSRSALQGGRRLSLPVAPFTREGQVLVPARAVAAALGHPVGFDAPTDSLLFPPGPEGLRQVVPLPSMRRGIVIHTPRPGETVAPNAVRVFGQANEFEGHVVLQLQRPDGTVLVEASVTGAMGSFGPFTADLIHVRSGDPGGPVRIVAFSPSAKDGRPLDTVVIPLTLGPAP